MLAKPRFLAIPEPDDILKTLDLSLALRHIKSRNGSYPSALLTKADSGLCVLLEQIELRVLEAQEILELQSQFAGLAPEHLHDLEKTALVLSLNTARQYVELTRSLQRDKLSSRMVKNVLQAVHKLQKTTVEAANLTDKLSALLTIRKAQKSGALRAELATFSQHNKRLVEQLDRETQQLLNVLRPCPSTPNMRMLQAKAEELRAGVPRLRAKLKESGRRL
jgi:hypothetical protein